MCDGVSNYMEGWINRLSTQICAIGKMGLSLRPFLAFEKAGHIVVMPTLENLPLVVFVKILLLRQ